MPAPLNALVEITRAWLSKDLGYHTDVSIPVRPSAESVKATTPMDIDIVCTHPKLGQVPTSLGNEKYTLPRNLLVECKGWFDYPSAPGGILRDLMNDMKLMGDEKFIPKSASKKREGLHFTFLKEEIYEKGKELFGGDVFWRVLVCPRLQSSYKPRNGSLIRKDELLKKAASDYEVLVVELPQMVEALVRYCRRPEAKDFLRRDFVLELLHLLDVARKLN